MNRSNTVRTLNSLSTRQEAAHFHRRTKECRHCRQMAASDLLLFVVFAVLALSTVTCRASSSGSTSGWVVPLAILADPPPISLTFDPPVADCSVADTVVTVTADVTTDVPLEYLFAQPRLTDENNPYLWFSMNPTRPWNPLNLSSRWQGQITVPKGSPAGDHVIAFSRDFLGQWTDVPLGGLRVVNLGNQDLHPPVLRSLTIDRSEIDLRQGDQRVTFTVAASDDVVGLERILILGAFRGEVLVDEAVRLSGTTNDGTWQFSVSVGKNELEPGVTPLRVFLFDRLYRTFDRMTDAADFPGDFRGNFTVNAYGRTVIKRWEISPNSVDVTNGPKEVTFTAEIECPGGFRSAWLTAPGLTFTELLGEGMGTVTVQKKFSLPRGMVPKQYPVKLEVSQRSGRGALYPPESDDLTLAWLDGAISDVEVMNTGAVDHTPPELVGVEVPNPVILEPGGDAYFIPMIRLSDDLSGVQRVDYEVRDDAHGVEHVYTADSPYWNDPDTWALHYHSTRTGRKTFTLTLTDNVGNERTYSQALVVTVVAPENPFSYWMERHFRNYPTSSNPMSDVDDDGVPNLLEYAFGTWRFGSQPAVRRPPSASYFPEWWDYYGEPVVETLPNRSLRLSWWRPVDLAAMKLRCSPQMSSDLIQWWPLVGEEVVIPDSNNNGREWVTITTPPLSETHYARMRVDLLR
jgi:hypothetical protein